MNAIFHSKPTHNTNPGMKMQQVWKMVREFGKIESLCRRKKGNS
jgi:hypothetical protein